VTTDFLSNPPRDAQGLRNYGVAWTPSRLLAKLSVRAAAPQIMDLPIDRDVVLWPALFEEYSDWSFGRQGTGDCVSWGWKHCLDIRMSVLAALGGAKRPDALHCQESIYGFGKCELKNSYGFHGSGMSGVDAARATNRFGCLYRKTYPTIDLSEYSGDRAIAWGESPRRTHGVPDDLEPIAKEHCTLDYAVVQSLDSAAKLIVGGFPFIYCGYTYWGTRRGDDGLATSFDSGWHCMTATGVRFKDGKPWAFWIANTGHGNHCSGPLGPFNMPSTYADCGSWIPIEKIEPVILAGDCYSTSIVGGWEPLLIPDWGFYPVQ
jgi:hypothetical protein